MGVEVGGGGGDGGWGGHSTSLTLPPGYGM